MRLIQFCGLFWLPIIVAFPQTGLLESLRKIVSGATKFNTDFLDDFSVPDSMVPEEFKFIRFGLCGSQPTLSCNCEIGAPLQSINFPRDNPDFTFKDLKVLFGHCRPT